MLGQHEPREYEEAVLEAQRELAEEPRAALRRLAAMPIPPPPENGDPDEAAMHVTDRQFARAHELLAEQGLEEVWDRVDLRSAMQLAFAETAISSDKRVFGKRATDSEIVLGILASAGTAESPIYETEALRRAAAKGSSRGVTGVTLPDPQGVREHVRAEQLLLERGWAKRNREGALEYDADTLAGMRIDEPEAYTECLAQARKELGETD